MDWKRVEQPPKNKFKKLGNTSLAVEICKEKMKFNMINICGNDIHNGERKLVLATMWLLQKLHTTNMIGGKTD